MLVKELNKLWFYNIIFIDNNLFLVLSIYINIIRDMNKK